MVGVPRSQRVAIFERGGVNYISFTEILLSKKTLVLWSLRIDFTDSEVLNLYHTKYIPILVQLCNIVWN